MESSGPNVSRINKVFDQLGVEKDNDFSSQTAVFVPPKDNTSTPDFHVMVAGDTSGRTSAFAKRAPSMQV
ncbi:MAG: hypothetical protein ACNYPI_06370 [Arenicellales bacterium WSBS_2016_MAG_OTU3]